MAGSPFGIEKSSESEDLSAALALFSTINSKEVIGAGISGEGDLELDFGLGWKLQALGRVKHVDWTWGIDSERGNLVTCDSGRVFAKKGVADL